MNFCKLPLLAAHQVEGRNRNDLVREIYGYVQYSDVSDGFAEQCQESGIDPEQFIWLYPEGDRNWLTGEPAPLTVEARAFLESMGK
jgi:hypothetical protein